MVTEIFWNDEAATPILALFFPPMSTLPDKELKATYKVWVAFGTRGEVEDAFTPVVHRSPLIRRPLQNLFRPVEVNHTGIVVKNECLE